MSEKLWAGRSAPEAHRVTTETQFSVCWRKMPKDSTGSTDRKPYFCMSSVFSGCFLVWNPGLNLVLLLHGEEGLWLPARFYGSPTSRADGSVATSISSFSLSSPAQVPQHCDGIELRLYTDECCIAPRSKWRYGFMLWVLAKMGKPRLSLLESRIFPVAKNVPACLRNSEWERVPHSHVGALSVGQHSHAPVPLHCELLCTTCLSPG